MRKLLPLSLLLTTLVLGAILGIVRLDPLFVRAQDSLGALPDLSHVNIYFSEAQREMSRFDRSDDGISRFAGLLRLAGANLFTLEWRNGIPADADLIVIAGPTADISADNVARLWIYLQGGGRVLLLADAFDRDGEVSRALPSDTLFELTWSEFGLHALETIIVREVGTAQIDAVETDRQGNVTFTYTGEAPVLATDFYTRRVNSAHPITSGLAPLFDAGNEETAPNLHRLYFAGARALGVGPSSRDFRVTPLVFTDTADLYAESNYARYLSIGYSEYNIGDDRPGDDLILAAAYEDLNSTGRMVLIGDGDIVRNGTGFLASPSYSDSFVYPVNVQFMLRTVYWLFDTEPAVIDLPTPAPTATATITPSPTPSPMPTATPANG